jgi:hypothetical protein
MTDRPINKNHSLGTLRPAKKQKDKSPDWVGKLRLKRDLLLHLLKQLGEEDEVTANLAGWKRMGPFGPHMTIEISPRYERRDEPIDSDPFSDFV